MIIALLLAHTIRVMKCYTLIIWLMLSYAKSYAQPTLTASTSNPIVGEQYYEYYCKTAGVAVGASGAGITWNYSALIDTASDTVSIVTCASTPYCDSFAGSNAVAKRHINDYYWAYNTDVDKWEIVASYQANPFPTFAYQHRPYRFLKYPITYADAWHDTSYYTVLSNYQHTSQSQYHNAEGYGTLITPAGTFTNCLLVHTTAYIADTHFHVSPPFIQYFRQENFFWYQPATHHNLLMISQLFDSTTISMPGTEIEKKVQFGSPSMLTSVAQVSGESKIAVFPNPAVDYLYLQLPPDMLNAEVALTDITGRLVATSIEQFNARRTLLIAALPSGIYLAQVKSGDFVATKKVVIAR
jgi:hypothetical protein